MANGETEPISIRTVERERQALRMQVIEGCEAISEEYLEMESAFHASEEEAHRGFEP